MIPYVNAAKEWRKQGKSYLEILPLLKNVGATYPISLITLKKLGLTTDNAVHIIDKSGVWKNESYNIQEIFFEFVELDDDLIDDSSLRSNNI